MASEGKHPHEFRRYRQGLLALYFAVVAAGAVLLVASVVWQLIVSQPAPERPALAGDRPISVENPSPEALLHCHAELSKLLTRTVDTASELISVPRHEGRAELDEAWSDRSRQWRADYEAVGAHCRFPDLAAAREGAAFERMSEVFAGLPDVRDAYRDLLHQFDDHLADELAQMRRALERSRDALLRHERAVPPP